MESRNCINEKPNELIISNKEYAIKIDDYMIKHCEKNSDKIIIINEDEKDDQNLEEVIKNEIDDEKIVKNKKEYMKKYYEANKDKIIERTRARYKLKHKDVEKKKCVTDNKEYMKNYHKQNKEYMKNYYKQNKDKIKERSNNMYKIKKELKASTTEN